MYRRLQHHLRRPQHHHPLKQIPKLPRRSSPNATAALSLESIISGLARFIRRRPSCLEAVCKDSGEGVMSLWEGRGEGEPWGLVQGDEGVAYVEGVFHGWRDRSVLLKGRTGE